MHERGELACDRLVLCVELGDLGATAAQQAEPQHRWRIEPSRARVARNGRQPRAHLRCVGEPLDQGEREIAKQRFGFCKQLLTALH
jgi:hypothetical protein